MICRTNRYSLKCCWHGCGATLRISIYAVQSTKPEVQHTPIGEGAVTHSYCEAHRDLANDLGFKVTRQYAFLPVLQTQPALRAHDVERRRTND